MDELRLATGLTDMEEAGDCWEGGVYGILSGLCREGRMVGWWCGICRERRKAH